MPPTSRAADARVQPEVPVPVVTSPRRGESSRRRWARCWRSSPNARAMNARKRSAASSRPARSRIDMIGRFGQDARERLAGVSPTRKSSEGNRYLKITRPFFVIVAEAERRFLPRSRSSSVASQSMTVVAESDTVKPVSRPGARRGPRAFPNRRCGPRRGSRPAIAGRASASNASFTSESPVSPSMCADRRCRLRLRNGTGSTGRGSTGRGSTGRVPVARWL